MASSEVIAGGAIARSTVTDLPSSIYFSSSQDNGSSAPNTDGASKARTRLPRTGGRWEGEPGNGKWYSDNPEIKEIIGEKPVEFIKGRPDFSPWSKGSFKFKPGELNGDNTNDFGLVYDKIKEIKDFKTQQQAIDWLNEKDVTLHHSSPTEIQLIPTKLHKNVPHIGSASDLRGGI